MRDLRLCQPFVAVEAPQRLAIELLLDALARPDVPEALLACHGRRIPHLSLVHKHETLTTVSPYIAAMTSSLLTRALAFFLLVAALLTIALVAVYSASQQVYRSSANDPQLAIAVNLAHRLDGGAAPATVAGGPAVDLTTSLSTHMSVYDRSGRLLASNARLDGAPPVPPSGVLDAARHDGKNVLTWEPATGVRVAAVVLPWRGGTILVGRSLRPVEDRISSLGLMLLAGWCGGILALAGASLISSWLWPRAPLLPLAP